MRLSIPLLLALTALSVTACGGLNESVMKQIETVGSDLAGVPVRVERVDLGLFRGLGEVTRVTMANPEGYQAEYAFQMDVARLNLGLLSLFSDPIVVEEMVIDSPIVNFEQRAPGVSNWREIAGNVRKNRGRTDRPSKKGDSKTDGAPEKTVRIVVQRLVIQGVTFNWRLPDGTVASGTLPAVELKDVGSPEGKTPEELGAVVAITMAREMFRQAAAPALRAWVAGANLPLEQLDPERIRKGLEQQVALTKEQWERVKAVIAELSPKLREAVDEARAQGFLDLENLARSLTAAAEQARRQLSEFLSREQMESVKKFLDALSQATIEEIRNALVEELTLFLKLTKEQIERLRPIIGEEIEGLSRLLNRLTTAPDWSLEDFMSRFEPLQEEMRRRIGEALDSDQVRDLKERQDRLRHLIQQAYFGIAGP
jgi:hypothetical protein